MEEPIEGLGPVHRAELGRLLPEFGGPGPHGPADVESHLRLFEAVATLLEGLAAAQPLVLILEDLHWADDMSLRLLAFVGRRLRTEPIALVVTVREEELADTHGLRRTLEELSREDALTRLALPLLSRAATTALVRALARAGSEDASAERLGEAVWTVSEGNPFMIVETVRALQEGTQSAGTSDLPLPNRVREVIVGRLERLSARGRHMVAVAAVIGREFEFTLLQRAAEVDEREAAEGMEELVRRRLLHCVGERLDFTHDRIRSVVYEQFAPPRRQLLHLQVAEVLEALYADRLDAIAAALAAHYRAGQAWGKSVEYLLRSARNAARVFAHEEAVGALREALAHAERLTAEERDARALEIVPRLARSLAFLGRPREVVELFASYQERVEQARNSFRAGRYYLSQSNTFSYLGDRERTAWSARRAMEEASRCGDTPTMGQAFYVLALEGFRSGQFREGLEYGRRAISLLEGTEKRMWLGHVHWVVGGNHLLIGELDRAREAFGRCAAIGEAIGDQQLETLGTWSIGVARAMQGEWDAGIQLCGQAMARSPDPVNSALALGWQGFAYLEKGDATEAIPRLRPSIQQLVRVGHSQGQGWMTIFLSEALLLSGRPEEAQLFAIRALELTRSRQYRCGIGVAQRALGRIARARGALPEAGACLAQALETLRSIDARYYAGRTHLDLASLAHARGERGAVRTHLNEAYGLFAALEIPRYVEQTQQLAADLRMPLSWAETPP
ncbi:MAG: AAA family ATPase [Candidatus Rokubacteria bacterium]|nr:AAA family ATPase [Candidatus Rokubacteria bacterium]